MVQADPAPLMAAIDDGMIRLNVSNSKSHNDIAQFEENFKMRSRDLQALRN
jgi:hypothetical protein